MFKLFIYCYWFLISFLMCFKWLEDGGAQPEAASSPELRFFDFENCRFVKYVCCLQAFRRYEAFL